MTEMRYSLPREIAATGIMEHGFRSNVVLMIFQMNVGIAFTDSAPKTAHTLMS